MKNKLIRFFRFLRWLEKERIKAMIYCGRGFMTLLFLLSFNLYAQTSEKDSTTISNAELEEVFDAIDTLLYQDSIKTVLIEDLQVQIRNYENLTNTDSLLLIYKQRQIDLLGREIELYDDRLKKVDKWYKKPWVGFIVGCATTTLSSWIVYNIK